MDNPGEQPSKQQPSLIQYDDADRSTELLGQYAGDPLWTFGTFGVALTPDQTFRALLAIASMRRRATGVVAMREGGVALALETDGTLRTGRRQGGRRCCLTRQMPVIKGNMCLLIAR